MERIGGPTREGNISLPGAKPKSTAEKEKDDEVPSEITVHVLQGETRDFRLKRTDLKRVEYFEDMLLAEGERYRLARDYARAFECYLRVQTRNPGWTDLDVHVNKLLFDEGNAALLGGDGEKGLRLLGELAARRPDYPGLADRLAEAYGSRIGRAFDLGLYARGRKELRELEAAAPGHAAVREARGKFVAREPRALVEEAGRRSGAERLDALTTAIRIWPDLAGLDASFALAFSGGADTRRGGGRRADEPWPMGPIERRRSARPPALRADFGRRR